MVSNPMQRKSKNSFILGLIIGLFVTIVVAVIMFLQIKALQDKNTKLIGDRKKIYVLTEDVESGDIVTKDMFRTMEVDVNTIPKGATQNKETIESYFSVDQDDDPIVTLTDANGNLNKYVEKDGERYILTEKSGKYYATINGEEKEIKFKDGALVAKIKMNKNTVVTANMFTTTEDGSGDDVRLQEYNMISVPANIKNGEKGKNGSFVDIRLRMPSGLDYIVVSKKRVEMPEDMTEATAGNTIWLRMTEEETIIMSEAIVETYMMDGAMLYAAEYAEPGIQSEAIPTYIPSETTFNLIAKNPNVVQEAATAIYNRYNADKESIGSRSKISGEVSRAENADDNLVSKTETEISTRQTQRKTYLEELAGN